MVLWTNYYQHYNDLNHYIKGKTLITLISLWGKVSVCILHVQLAVRVTQSLIRMKLRFKNENNNGFIHLVFIMYVCLKRDITQISWTTNMLYTGGAFVGTFASFSKVWDHVGCSHTVYTLYCPQDCLRCSNELDAKMSQSWHTFSKNIKISYWPQHFWMVVCIRKEPS